MAAERNEGIEDVIKDRPKHLLSQKLHSRLPQPPLHADWQSVPELVRTSLLQLGGVQPITVGSAQAAGDTLRDKPSPGEVEYHRARKTNFQMIFVVSSLCAAQGTDGQIVGRPFAISLYPASKRGRVEQKPIELVKNLDLDKLFERPSVYEGFNPFTGDRGLFGGADLLVTPGKSPGFLDEIGWITDAYWLATQYDESEVLIPETGVPDVDFARRYRRHLIKLLFNPFTKLSPRKVWGADSPIELFLIQELSTRGHHPALQMLIFDDGSAHPSWPHLWRDACLSDLPKLITEADLFFADERIAVFCDSRRYHRGAKARAKDAAIDDRLRDVGIEPVRVMGREIVQNLEAAAGRVLEKLP